MSGFRMVTVEQSPSEYRTSKVLRWTIFVLNSNAPVIKWHLNTGQLVRFPNGQLALPMYCGLKTGRVFKWL
jgi:hypothetical protein